MMDRRPVTGHANQRDTSFSASYGFLVASRFYRARCFLLSLSSISGVMDRSGFPAGVSLSRSLSASSHNLGWSDAATVIVVASSECLAGSVIQSTEAPPAAAWHRRAVPVHWPRDTPLGFLAVPRQDAGLTDIPSASDPAG